MTNHPTPAPAPDSVRTPARRALALTTLLLGLAGLGGLPQASIAATEASGRIVTEARNVADFSGISLRGSMNLVVTQGDKAAVTVRVSDNLLPLLETVVEGQRLVIGWKKGENLYRTGPVMVTVVTPRLDNLSVAGSGDAELGSFSTPSLKVSVAGSGNARLVQLKTDDLGISVAGSGDVRGAGQARKLSLTIAGSGDAQLDRLQADDVSVSIAGSGDAEVHASKTLAVNIAGSGDVLYTGDATVSRTVVGSGSVRKR